MVLRFLLMNPLLLLLVLLTLMPRLGLLLLLPLVVAMDILDPST